MLEPTGLSATAIDRTTAGPLLGASSSRLLAAALLSVCLAFALAHGSSGPAPSAHPAASAGSLATRSAAQGLDVAFGRAGVQISSGATRVGLTLRAAGSGAQLEPVGKATRRYSGGTFSYLRLGLDEWYVKRAAGVEQGFTVARPLPDTARGTLTLALSLSGDARAALAPGGQSVTFTSGSGPALSYGGLVATDARGRSLPSRLALAGRELELRVDVRGARFPVRIDPLTQLAKLLAGESADSGFFGSSVAISADGNTALVGAPSPKSPGGTAWVFTRSGSAWTQQGPPLTKVLEEPEAEGETGTGEEEPRGFGRSVALSGDGDVAVIGAPREHGHHGLAWVFMRSGSGSSWDGEQLPASKESDKGEFGRSVALAADGRFALVGAPEDESSKGSATVFELEGSKWVQIARLTDSEALAGAAFGQSVAISENGQLALIGAPGVSGTAYVFTAEGSKWTQRATLSRDASGRFGVSVALSASGETALIGGDAEDGGAGLAWVFSGSAPRGRSRVPPCRAPKSSAPPNSGRASRSRRTGAKPSSVPRTTKAANTTARSGSSRARARHGRKTGASTSANTTRSG